VQDGPAQPEPLEQPPQVGVVAGYADVEGDLPGEVPVRLLDQLGEHVRVAGLNRGRHRAGQLQGTADPRAQSQLKGGLERQPGREQVPAGRFGPSLPQGPDPRVVEEVGRGEGVQGSRVVAAMLQ
jgi:hypothetical protein